MSFAPPIGIIIGLMESKPRTHPQSVLYGIILGGFGGLAWPIGLPAYLGYKMGRRRNLLS